MATELVAFKVDKGFLHEIDITARSSGFQNRTEFIRSALRDKVAENRLRIAIAAIGGMKGKAKTKTSEKELEQIRERVFCEIEKNIK